MSLCHALFHEKQKHAGLGEVLDRSGQESSEESGPEGPDQRRFQPARRATRKSKNKEVLVSRPNVSNFRRARSLALSAWEHYP